MIAKTRERTFKRDMGSDLQLWQNIPKEGDYGRKRDRVVGFFRKTGRELNARERNFGKRKRGKRGFRNLRPAGGEKNGC